MTLFEELAQELGVKITTDRNGVYNGMCAALAAITSDVVLSDDERVFNMPWEDQKEVITARFYITFPYMKEREKDGRL